MSGACEGCAVAGLARAGAQRGEPDVEGVVAEGPDAEGPDAENGPTCWEETAVATGHESDGGGPSRSVPPSPGEGRRARTVLPGLSDTEVVRLVTAVSGGSPGGACSSDAAVERFARAALTTAVEPGDLEAGRLVAALGPERVVRAVVEGHDAERVLRAARDAEVVPLRRGAPRAAFEDASPERAAEDARAVRRIAECLERWRPRLSLDESCRAVERASRLGVQLLTPDADVWPEGFASLEGGEPLALWIRGDPNRLTRLEHSVALVGARASTDYGEHVAMEAAAGLAGRGFAVVSGGDAVLYQVGVLRSCLLYAAGDTVDLVGIETGGYRRRQERGRCAIVWTRCWARTGRPKYGGRRGGRGRLVHRSALPERKWSN